MKTAFEHIINSNQLLAIRIDEYNPNKFIVGKPLGHDDDHILILMVDPYGEFDGFAILSKDKVISIEIHNEYLKCVELLSSDWLSIINDLPKIDNGDAILSLIEYSQTNKCVIAIEVREDRVDSVVGYVDWISGDGLCLRKLNEYGDNDGKAYIAISDITAIFCNSKDEQKLLRLNAIKSFKRKG